VVAGGWNPVIRTSRRDGAIRSRTCGQRPGLPGYLYEGSLNPRAGRRGRPGGSRESWRASRSRPMTTSSGERNPVELLAEDCLDRKRAAERPTLGEYLERSPELAEEIRALFPALLMMEDLGESSGGSTGSLAADDGLAVAARLDRLGDYRILREVGRGGMGV